MIQRSGQRNMTTVQWVSFMAIALVHTVTIGVWGGGITRMVKNHDTWITERDRLDREELAARRRDAEEERAK